MSTMVRPPFDPVKFQRLFATPPSVMKTRGNMSRGMMGVRNQYNYYGLGFAVDVGGVAINDTTGGWSISDTTGSPIVAGTAPMVTGSQCPDPVPIQNAIQQYILAPISDHVSYNTQLLTQTDLQVMLNALQLTQTNWLNYLHNAQCLQNSTWASRSRGAETTLAPYFTGLIAKCNLLMQTAPGGSQTINPIIQPPIPGATPGGGLPGSSIISGVSNTTLLLGAVAAWFLLK